MRSRQICYEMLQAFCACCCGAGSFSADKLSGNGVYYYSNGDIYSGGFLAGKKHGSGQMFFKVWHKAGRL